MWLLHRAMLGNQRRSGKPISALSSCTAWVPSSIPPCACWAPPAGPSSHCTDGRAEIFVQPSKSIDIHSPMLGVRNSCIDRNNVNACTGARYDLVKTASAISHPTTVPEVSQHAVDRPCTVLASNIWVTKEHHNPLELARSKKSQRPREVAYVAPNLGFLAGACAVMQ